MKTLSVAEKLTLLYHNYLAIFKNPTDSSSYVLQVFCHQKIIMAFNILKQRNFTLK